MHSSSKLISSSSYKDTVSQISAPYLEQLLRYCVCKREVTIAIMAESKKGHNFAIIGPTEKKNMGSLIFFVLMLYIKFQVPSSSRSLDIVGTLFSQNGE